MNCQCYESSNGIRDVQENLLIKLEKWSWVYSNKCIPYVG